MRAFEIFEEFERKPGFTLRHLNKLKRHKQAIDKERAERDRLVSIMYSSPEITQQHYETERAKLGFEKEKLEFLAKKLELETDYKFTLVDMRNAGRENRKQTEELPKYGRKRKPFGSN